MAVMTFSSSKSKAMVLNQKKVEYLLLIKAESLPQVSLRISRMLAIWGEGWTDGLELLSAVRKVLLWSVVVKRELSWKEKFSIYWSIVIPTLT